MKRLNRLSESLTSHCEHAHINRALEVAVKAGEGKQKNLNHAFWSIRDWHTFSETLKEHLSGRNDAATKAVRAILGEMRIKGKHAFGPEDFIIIDRSAESGVLKGRAIFQNMKRDFDISPKNVVYVSQNSLVASTEGESPQWVYFHEYAVRMAKAHRETDLGSDIISCEKKVLCMNNKVRPHRLATVLSARAALGDDLVFSWQNSNALFSDDEVIRQAATHFPQSMKLDIGQLSFAHPSFQGSRGDAVGLPEEISQRCYLHLVPESDFLHWSDRFTEKVLKPMIARRPFLVMGPAGVLATMRKAGFKTFEGIIDESYDAERNHQNRLNMIIAETQRIHQGSMTDFLCACKEVIEFNNQFLRFKLKDHIYSVFERGLGAAVKRAIHGI